MTKPHTGCMIVSATDASPANDNNSRATQIAARNDEFRHSIVALTLAGRAGNAAALGRLRLARSIGALPATDQLAIVNAVRRFTAFNDRDDPHREHASGTFAHRGQPYRWKIDGSPAAGPSPPSANPADCKSTTRVLTIMRADEA